MLMSKSAVKNSETPIHMISGNLNDSLSEADKKFMQKYAEYIGLSLEIKDLTMPADLTNYLGKSAIAYLPLLFLDTLTQDFIWLDSDLLLDSDWDLIFTAVPDERNREKHVVAAVKDRIATSALLRTEARNSSYLKRPEHYFNSGVVWMSPTAWKANNFDKQWAAVVRKDEELGLQYNEQDTLNYMLHNHVTFMPQKFNYMPGDLTDEEPVITHFAGYPKPWVLSARAKALYLMTEAINWNRPQFRPSREGKFKTEYFAYWQAEEDLLLDLQVHRADLYEEALRRKRVATREINNLEKIKYAIFRFISVEFRNAIIGKKPTLTGTQSQLWKDFD